MLLGIGCSVRNIRTTPDSANSCHEDALRNDVIVTVVVGSLAAMTAYEVRDCRDVSCAPAKPGMVAFLATASLAAISATYGAVAYPICRGRRKG